MLFMGMIKKTDDWAERHNRPDLTGEYPPNDFLQIVWIIIFFTVWIADSFFLRWTTVNSVPLIIRATLGALCIIAWAYLAKSGISIVFGEKRETPSVIRKGAFSYVRHPIYESTVLFFLAYSIFTFSIISLALTAAVALYYNFAMAYEEDLLINRFGKEYEDYMKEVPRWGVGKRGKPWQ